LGISTVYQEVNLCANLSVAENIFAGRYPRKGLAGAWAIDWSAMHRDARTLLARAEPRHRCHPERWPATRSQCSKWWPLPGRLSISAQVLILDEPTSSLDDEEVERLYVVLRQLRDQGMAILFVTHFLDQVYALCDRITVLRNGELVGEYPAAALGAQRPDRGHGGPCSWQPAHGAQCGSTANRPRGTTPEWLQAKALNRPWPCESHWISASAGARWWAWAACWARGAPSWRRLLFGLDRSDAGEITLERQDRARWTRRSPPSSWGWACARKTARPRASSPSSRCAKTLCWPCRPAKACGPLLAGCNKPTPGRGLCQSPGHQDRQRGHAHRAALRRQPAKGSLGPLAGHATQPVDTGRTDARHRHRRQAGNHERDPGNWPDKGMAVLFISSEMEEVVRVSDRIVVLRDRAKVGELPAGTNEPGGLRHDCGAGMNMANTTSVVKRVQVAPLAVAGGHAGC